MCQHPTYVHIKPVPPLLYLTPLYLRDTRATDEVSQLLRDPMLAYSMENSAAISEPHIIHLEQNVPQDYRSFWPKRDELESSGTYVPSFPHCTEPLCVCISTITTDSQCIQEMILCVHVVMSSRIVDFGNYGSPLFLLCVLFCTLNFLSNTSYVI